MNFCFWPDNPSGVFEYIHITKNLEKILRANPEFFTCAELKKVNREYLKEHVFTTEKEFCLLESRALMLNEIAQQVEKHFNSSFYSFVEQSNFDAPTFVSMVAQYF